MGFKLNWFSLIIDKQKPTQRNDFQEPAKNNPVVGKYLRIFCRRQISTIPPFAEIHQPYFRRGNAVELNLRNAFCAFCTILHLFQTNLDGSRDTKSGDHDCDRANFSPSLCLLLVISCQKKALLHQFWSCHVSS